MDNPGEILRLCRLCLVKDQVNIPIFEEQGDIRQIFLKISSCLPVTVSRDDQLPKKICDGCSNKLDLLYEFWNTSANAEKTLLSWLGQAGVKDADETISAVAQQIAKPAEPQVKQEDLEDGHAISQQDNFGLQSFDEDTKDEAEPPPRKRARRTAAVKAQISIAPESDDDDDDMDNTEAMTKVEGESEESDGEDRDPSYGEVPGTSADDQAGPSGVGKDGVEAPLPKRSSKAKELPRSHQPKCYFRQCYICKQLITAKKYRNHIHFHHLKVRIDKEISENPEPKIRLTGAPLECNICKKKFARKDALLLHKTRKHVDKDKRTRYQCDMCGQLFLDKNRVETHIQRAHLKQFKYKCQHCGKGCLYLGELNHHVKSVHDKQEVTLIGCTYENCNKVFKTSGALKYHLHNHIQDKPTFVCDQCGKVFDHPYLHNRHLRTHKVQRKKYACKICEKEMASIGSLADHMRLHSGERPFICEHCGKGFRTRPILASHLVVHTKVKKHICKACGKAFTQRSPLKNHIVKFHPGVSNI